MKKTITFILFSLLLLFSCSNDELSEDLAKTVSQEQKGSVDILNLTEYTVFTKPNDEVTFTYKGVEYFTKYNIVDDSIFIYENPRVGELLELLDSRDPAVFVRKDGILDYFDNIDELYREKGLNSMGNYTQQRQMFGSFGVNYNITSNPQHAAVVFYRDSHYRGENIAFYYAVNVNIIRVNYLGDYNLQYSKKSWNDQPCSIIVGSWGYLTVYRDSGFGGVKYIFPGPAMIPDLSAYRCSSNRNWNNQISSFEI